MQITLWKTFYDICIVDMDLRIKLVQALLQSSTRVYHYQFYTLVRVYSLAVPYSSGISRSLYILYVSRKIYIVRRHVCTSALTHYRFHPGFLPVFLFEFIVLYPTHPYLSSSLRLSVRLSCLLPYIVFVKCSYSV